MFIWEAEWQRGRDRDRLSANYSPDAHRHWDRIGLKWGARNIRVSHVTVRGPVFNSSFTAFWGASVGKWIRNRSMGTRIIAVLVSLGFFSKCWNVFHLYLQMVCLVTARNPIPYLNGLQMVCWPDIKGLQLFYQAGNVVKCVFRQAAIIQKGP